MLKPVHSSDMIIAARTTEFFAPHSPWHRSLWAVSLPLLMEELLEACGATQTGVLGEPSVKRLVALCKRVAGQDPAMETHERNTLNEALRDVPRLNGVAYYTVEQLGKRVGSSYLRRWAGILEGRPAQAPERVARSLASYLLDVGFSQRFLHDWFVERFFKRDADQTLPEVLREADEEFANRESQTFEVLLAFKAPPQSASGYPAGWLSADQVASWLRHEGFSTAELRQSGGFVLRLKARDVFAAADAATAVIDGYVARASIGAGKPLQPLPILWIRNHPEGLAVSAKHRGVRVRALYREDQIFTESAGSNVDSAIELLAHLQNSSPSTAIAGGWAAIESLLGEAGDRSAAADSLASLVACSYPRAEFTHLSHLAQKLRLDISRVWGNTKVNRDRAAAVAEEIAKGTDFGFTQAKERAAIARMRALLQAPSPTLSSVQSSVSEVFHRLYRQRNMILHGGITNSVALNSALRAAAPLAGAGVDRIAHGFYVQGLKSRELAARAKIGIALLTPGSSAACVDLLDT
jgi:hypothetical protein